MKARVCIGSAKSGDALSDSVDCLYILRDVMGIDTLAMMRQLGLLPINEMYESVTILLCKHCSTASYLAIHFPLSAHYGTAWQSTKAALKEFLVPQTPDS